MLNCPSLPLFNEVNPVRNSIEASNPAGIILGRNSAVGGTAEPFDPALRGTHGPEYIKGHPGIISNGVKFACLLKKFPLNG